jgi:hypothetical protein
MLADPCTLFLHYHHHLILTCHHSCIFSLGPNFDACQFPLVNPDVPSSCLPPDSQPGSSNVFATNSTNRVTDLQGPPSEHMQSDKIRDLKSLAQQYARDQGSCDDMRISYLEFVESEVEADLTLARMIAG